MRTNSRREIAVRPLELIVGVVGDELEVVPYGGPLRSVQQSKIIN